MRHGHLVTIGGKCPGDRQADAAVASGDQDRSSHAGIFTYTPIGGARSNRAHRKSHSGWPSAPRTPPSKHQVGDGEPIEEDTMTAVAIETGVVTTTRLADSLLVQLTGELGQQHVTE